VGSIERGGLKKFPRDKEGASHVEAEV